MRRFTPLAAVLAATLLLSACGTVNAARRLGSAAFTKATLSDLEMEGVLTQTCVSLVAMPADPRQEDALVGLLTGKTVGCLLGVSRTGSTAKEWIFCGTDREAECKAIPINAKVKFTGQPFGRGGVWNPTRLTWSE